jgi:hypothetical protein
MKLDGEKHFVKSEADNVSLSNCAVTDCPKKQPNVSFLTLH